MATQKPLTENPLITDDANKIIKALMTKVNKPKVRMLIGKVIKIKTGLTRTLMIPKNKASHKAVQKPATATPGIKYELIIIATTMRSHLIINDINFVLLIISALLFYFNGIAFVSRNNLKFLIIPFGIRKLKIHS